MGLTTDHEKSRAWTQIWLIDNGYFAGVEESILKELKASLLDFLDVERNLTLPRDDREDSREAAGEKANPITKSTRIHDPALYSFGEKRKWIPWAKDAPSGAKRGWYAKGYPEGLVVHWTAGHRNGLERGNELMRDTGMLYLLMDAAGNVAQSDSLARWGYHAGSSSHSAVSGTVSNEFAGVELQAAGQLAKFGNDYFPWWDRDPKTKQYQRLDKNKIPAREVIQVTKREGNLATGYYHAYTMEQMMMLRVLCVWLHLNNPDVFSIDRVVGHDEVSPGRKVDPGGALWWGRKGEATERLPMTMAEFRDLLWRDVAAVQKNQK